MADDRLDDYGWRAGREDPGSCAYLVPDILAVLDQFGLRAAGTRILDLGSGNGALCAALHEAGHEVVGVERDPRGVEIARQRVPTVRFHQLAIDDDPAHLLDRESLFNVVVSTEVVEHLYAPRQLPRFAHRVLVEGGVLVVSTPYHGYLKNLMLSLFNQWDQHLDPFWDGGHIKFWSAKTLARLLEEGGFEVIGFKGSGRWPVLWKSMILVARRRLPGARGGVRVILPR